MRLALKAWRQRASRSRCCAWQQSEYFDAFISAPQLMIADAFKWNWRFKLGDGCFAREIQNRRVGCAAAHELLTKLFQPLANVHGVADDRIVYAAWCTDVANRNNAAVQADPQLHRLRT